MNVIRRVVVGLAGVIVVALAMELAAPKAVHALVSTLVTVANTSGNPVPTMAVDTRNVNVVNTPNVNVNSLPAVQVSGGNINATVSGTVPVSGSVNATLTGSPTVALSGNVPVVNPLDNNQNSVSLDVEANDSSPVEAQCRGTFSGIIGSCTPQITIPAGMALVIDDVSISVGLIGGQAEGSVFLNPDKGGTGAIVFDFPLEPQGTNPFGILLFLGAQRTHLYSFALPPGFSGPPFCEAVATQGQSSSASMACTIVGHLVPAH